MLLVSTAILLASQANVPVTPIRTLSPENVLQRFPMRVTRGARTVEMPGAYGTATPQSQTLPEQPLHLGRPRPYSRQPHNRPEG